MKYRLQLPQVPGTSWTARRQDGHTSNWLRNAEDCMTYVELACLGLEYTFANVIDHEIYKNFG